jgi:hypothetical protein
MKTQLFKCGALLFIAGCLCSCQIKGMYTAKGGAAMPFNASLMKKSTDDVQYVKSPEYTYFAQTVGGDETIVPSKAISWWGWAKIASSAASAFGDWSADKAAVDSLKSSNATTLGVEQLKADVAIKTFVP